MIKYRMGTIVSKVQFDNLMNGFIVSIKENSGDVLYFTKVLNNKISAIEYGNNFIRRVMSGYEIVKIEEMRNGMRWIYKECMSVGEW